MKFCSACGQPVSYRIPADDNRNRHICDSCNTIHYQNPRIIVGCLPVYQDKILLCLRSIEPRKGYWTLPAGFLENGESTEQGAQRETWEEACARAQDLELYTMFDLPHIAQVYMFYRAEVADGEFGVGEESADAALFDERDIPWKELAFPVIGQTLEHFFADRAVGEFPLRKQVIEFPYKHKKR